MSISYFITPPPTLSMHQNDIRQLSIFFKAIANERRIKIIHLLMRGKSLSVSDVAESIRLSFRSTSHHLRILRSAKIAEYEQQGPQIHYTLNTHHPFFDILRRVCS